MVQYTVNLTSKENQFLADISDQLGIKDIKELLLTLAILVKEDVCTRCYQKLITNAKLCRNCGKLFLMETEDIERELDRLGYKKENPVTEFYEPDVKRFSKLTKEGKIETDVPAYLKEKREAIK